MNRRGVIVAVGSGLGAVSGCFGADDSRSDATPSVASPPEITASDRATIVACERARIRAAYFDADGVPPDEEDDAIPDITTIGSMGEYARVDLETEWGDRRVQPVIAISVTESTGVNAVPSSSADAFADLEAFQASLSDAVASGGGEIPADHEEYEAIRDAIESEVARFETGDSVYLEHEGKLLRLLSTESRAEPPNQVRASYFLSESELRRVIDSDEPSPEAATLVDC